MEEYDEIIEHAVNQKCLRIDFGSYNEDLPSCKANAGLVLEKLSIFQGLPYMRLPVRMCRNIFKETETEKIHHATEVNAYLFLGSVIPGHEEVACIET